jgi:uncharacterized protein YdeI (YjbR/CyaY-like superfamily)
MAGPLFFESAEEWRQWLAENHDNATEVFVIFRKVGSGLPGMSYREALDGALAFGWIDGVRHSIDATSYRNRFTPRRKGSYWSAVNIARVEELKRQGLMHPAGIAAFEARDPAQTPRYSSERKDIRLSAEYEARFRGNRKAWAFFEAQPVSYRRPATWWVMSAKREDTRDKRLATLIRDSAEGRRIAPLTPASRRNKV